MIIKGITVRIPPLLLGLTVLFAVVCAMSFAESGEWIYVWMGVPLCIVLLAFPLLLIGGLERHYCIAALPQGPFAVEVRAD